MKKARLLAFIGILALLAPSCADGSGSVSSALSGWAPVTEKSLVDNIPEDAYRNYYEIFVYSFADSNGDGVGDLKGIESKLDYIRSLGFTGIWLTPIFTSPSNHKYNAADYLTVDPVFGTNQDLGDLVTAAHAKGIKVILDLALNHSSRSNSWFVASTNAFAKKMSGYSLSAEEEEYASLYSLYDSEAAAKSSPQGTSRIFRSYHVNAYGEDVWYECNFDADMPEFDFDSDFTWTKFEEIFDLWQNDYGVDGFRLDAVKYYYLNDLAKNVAALSRIEIIAKTNDPAAYIVGECWDSSGIIKDYYASDLDSYFWFPAQGANGFISGSTGFSGGNNGDLATGQQEMEAAAGDHIPAPFLDNHDTARISGGNAVTNKFEYGLLSTLSGNTFTYYGTEIGINSGATGGDSDYRTYMDWGDSTNTQGVPGGTAYYPFGSVKDQETDPDSILAYVGKANAIRNALPGLARGRQTDYTADRTGRNLVIDKEYNGSLLRIVYNYSLSDSLEYTPTAGVTDVAYYLTAAADTTVDVNAQGVLRLPPRSIVFLS